MSISGFFENNIEKPLDGLKDVYTVHTGLLFILGNVSLYIGFIYILYRQIKDLVGITSLKNLSFFYIASACILISSLYVLHGWIFGQFFEFSRIYLTALGFVAASAYSIYLSVHLNNFFMLSEGSNFRFNLFYAAIFPFIYINFVLRDIRKNLV